MTPPARRLFRAATILASLAAALTLPAAPAGAAVQLVCPNATAQPFLRWGDSASYYFAPNGGFERGTTGWTLTGGARVVTGSEPFAVHAAGDSYALSLPAGSSATTSPMCIGALSTKMRFFARNTGASTSRLAVKVIYDGGLGQVLGIADAGTITAGKWQPSPAITMLGGVLPLLTQDVRVRLVPADATGAWSIDDVYVDPLMHR